MGDVHFLRTPRGRCGSAVAVVLVSAILFSVFPVLYVDAMLQRAQWTSMSDQSPSLSYCLMHVARHTFANTTVTTSVQTELSMLGFSDTTWANEVRVASARRWSSDSRIPAGPGSILPSQSTNSAGWEGVPAYENTTALSRAQSTGEHDVWRTAGNAPASALIAEASSVEAPSYRGSPSRDDDAGGDNVMGIGEPDAELSSETPREDSARVMGDETTGSGRVSDHTEGEDRNVASSVERSEASLLVGGKTGVAKSQQDMEAPVSGDGTTGHAPYEAERPATSQSDSSAQRPPIESGSDTSDGPTAESESDSDGPTEESESDSDGPTEETEPVSSAANQELLRQTDVILKDLQHNQYLFHRTAGYEKLVHQRNMERATNQLNRVCDELERVRSGTVSSQSGPRVRFSQEEDQVYTFSSDQPVTPERADMRDSHLSAATLTLPDVAEASRNVVRGAPVLTTSEVSPDVSSNTDACDTVPDAGPVSVEGTPTEHAVHSDATQTQLVRVLAPKLIRCKFRKSMVALMEKVTPAIASELVERGVIFEAVNWRNIDTLYVFVSRYGTEEIRREAFRESVYQRADEFAEMLIQNCLSTRKLCQFIFELIEEKASLPKCVVICAYELSKTGELDVHPNDLLPSLCRYNLVDHVSELMERECVDPNEPGDDGMEPVVEAVYTGNDTLIQMLLDAGAKYEGGDRYVIKKIHELSRRTRKRPRKSTQTEAIDLRSKQKRRRQVARCRICHMAGHNARSHKTKVVAPQLVKQASTRVRKQVRP